jgi:hypothetical protein
MRPTPEEIAEARVEIKAYRAGEAMRGCLLDHVDTLLAATEPPTDQEIAERYKAFLVRKGYQDRGNAIWFADGVWEFVGRAPRASTCACGNCPAKP